jgi:hypothetical protein
MLGELSSKYPKGKEMKRGERTRATEKRDR